MKTLLLTILIASFARGAPSEKVQENELLSVVAVFRHGDRSPIFTYKNDPYPSSFWPDGLGMLDNQGKERHFKLGKWLRKRYDGFLSRTYTKDEFVICSTDVDRALISAQANLAGLYTPEGEQIWKEDLLWQPIPVHTCPVPVFNSDSSCPKMTEKLEKFLTSSEVKKLNKENADLYEYLTTNTGTNFTRLDQIYILRDTLFVQSHKGLRLPDWTFDIFPERLQPLADLFFWEYGNIGIMNVGPLLTNIIEHFKNIASGTSSEPKFKMFSGHDSNLVSILSALGNLKPHCPYYANTIIFELWKKQNSFIVNVFYKDQEDCNIIRVNGCLGNCELSQFEWNLRQVAITNDLWLQQCFDKTGTK